MKGILEFLAKNNRWAIALVILLFVIGGGIFKFQNNKIKEWKGKHLTEVKLNKALNDTVHIYQGKDSLWVAEKLTIQAELKDLTDDKVKLTAHQKRLIDKVEEANKENDVITAALIAANVQIEGYQHKGKVFVDTTNKTASFVEDEDTTINYNMTAIGVLPFPEGSQPDLFINSLFIPNETFVKFQWDKDKRAGYPITFSVTNSNKYVKVHDINSYVIPELKREELNPTGWEKVGMWFKKNGRIVGYVAGGVVVGAAGTYVIMN